MRVMFTIDVEDPYYPQEMRRIWGRIGEETYGIGRIMDILDKYQFKGVFYVDVYERGIHGDEKMAEVIRYIHGRGHEVQLHSHPGTALTYGKGGLAKRSIDEQVKILEDGVQFIETHLGIRPTAHRSGGYKADNNTLKACSQLGLLCDSSLFYKNPNCLIQTPGVTYNDLATIEELLQIPVSTVQVKSPFFNVLMKIDIEQDYAVLQKGLDQLKQAQAEVAVFFLHSFSFLDVYQQSLRPNHSNLKKFDAICAYIQAASLQVVTVNDLGEPFEGKVRHFPEVKLNLPEALRIMFAKGWERLKFKRIQPFVQATKEKYDF